jgi:hypothetical protein
LEPLVSKSEKRTTNTNILTNKRSARTPKMQPTTIPYDGPNRYEILHLIHRFNAAHHELDYITTVGLTEEDNTKVESLATFERDREFKNTPTDSMLNAMIKDLGDIRKIGSIEEVANSDWERIATSMKKLNQLVDFNKKKYAAVKSQREKDAVKEQQRRDLEFYRQQKPENEAREGKDGRKEQNKLEAYRQQQAENEARATKGTKEKRDRDRQKLAERQAQTARLKGQFYLAFQNVAETKQRLGKENKSAPRPATRLEVPKNVARPINPGKQDRPVSPNIQNRPQCSNNQKQANVPNQKNAPKVPGYQNKVVDPKHNIFPSPVNKVKKERPRITTEVKEIRLNKAHEEALRLASEVRKFN